MVILKPVGQEATAPRQLSDTEEEALVAAVTAQGGRRDRALIVLMPQAGLRAGEVCSLRRDDVTLDTTMTYIKATRNDLRKEVETIAWV